MTAENNKTNKTEHCSKQMSSGQNPRRGKLFAVVAYQYRTPAEHPPITDLTCQAR